MDDTGLVLVDGYTNNAHCQWTLACSIGKPQLTFTSFDLEFNFDFLSVYNGAKADGQPAWELSGQSVPTPVMGVAATLAVALESDEVYTGDGFAAIFECISRCSSAQPSECLSETECVGAGLIWIGDACQAGCGTHNVAACLTNADCASVGAVWSEGACGGTGSLLISYQDDVACTRAATKTSCSDADLSDDCPAPLQVRQQPGGSASCSNRSAVRFR